MIEPLWVQGDLPAIISGFGNVYQGNLRHYFQAFVFTAKNLYHPYHGFRHPTHVLWLCHSASKYYKWDLSPLEARDLHIAGMWHDYDHTGTKGDDGVNIKRALAGLRKHLLPEDEPRWGNISFLIKASQYRYVVPDEELTLAAKILRDADLMQAFSVAWLQQVVFGLAKEWDQPFMDVLALQEDFLSSIRFYTDWANQLVPPESIRMKIEEARALHDILSDSPRTELLRHLMAA